MGVFGALLACSAIACGSNDAPLEITIDPGTAAAVLFNSKQDSLQSWTGRFYAGRGGLPVWVDSGDQRRARKLIEALGALDLHGLSPSRYAITSLDDRLAALDSLGVDADSTEAAQTDVALTQAFFLAADDMLRGRVPSDQIQTTWQTKPRAMDLVKVLEEVATGDEPGDALDELAPPHPEYEALREHLSRLREQAEAGGWEAIPPARLDSDVPEALLLRDRDVWERLALEDYIKGDFPGSEPGDTARYASRLRDAVARYQVDRGITPDSVIGVSTLTELNIPIESRIRTVLLNMERLRWMPAELPERRVEVNVAAFTLEAFDGGDVELDMNVIVGQEGWETPVFSDVMDHVIINPYWNVPETIATDEILPKIKEDPSYLEQRNYQVLDGWTDEAEEVDPEDVDWDSMSAESFPYRIRQEPGPSNALGRIKFMFPNEHAVYLHDTPADRLFDRTDRDLSHGCIRLERPLDFADYVFGQSESWDEERTAEAVDSEERVRVDLDTPVPVYILYWTATVADGRLRFFQDIYDVDKELDNALRAD